MTTPTLPAAGSAGSEEFRDLPLALMMEVTHRCPLACPYCSNPRALVPKSAEIPAELWLDIIRQGGELGALHAHFSGGEPLLRPDLEAMTRAAADAGMYTNLITSGAGPGDAGARLRKLRDAGMEHAQVSFQDAEPENADLIGGFRGGHARKLEFARAALDCGMSLTVNAPIHRRNMPNLPRLIEMAAQLGADKFEAAHVQYYGWGLENRAALIPTRGQVDFATREVARARASHRGKMRIDYVVPDYYARRPKPCMGGWGRKMMNVDPAGFLLPCHAAQSIPGLIFANAREVSLREAWFESDAFARFRGTEWMPEPCRSCAHKTEDWGGCRCQALAILGDPAQTDPACEFSPSYGILARMAESESTADSALEAAPVFVYRRMKNAPAAAA